MRIPFFFCFFFSCLLSPLKKFFFIVELTLSTPHFGYDQAFSRHGAAFTHFDSRSNHIFVIWTDVFVHFPFCEGGLGVLATCSLCYAEACAIPQALHRSCSNHKFCHFVLYSKYRSV